jgi:hypothetical protein
MVRDGSVHHPFPPEKLVTLVFRSAQPQLLVVSSLLQSGEPPTTALRRHYLRGHATTSGLLAVCWC